MILLVLLHFLRSSLISAVHQCTAVLVKTALAGSAKSAAFVVRNSNSAAAVTEPNLT